MTDPIVLAKFLEGLGVQARISGMLATNGERDRRGEAAAYTEEDFERSGAYLDYIAQQIMERVKESEAEDESR